MELKVAEDGTKIDSGWDQPKGYKRSKAPDVKLCNFVEDLVFRNCTYYELYLRPNVVENNPSYTFQDFTLLKKGQ